MKSVTLARICSDMSILRVSPLVRLTEVDPIPEGEVSLGSQGGSADIPDVPDRRGRAQAGGRLNEKNIGVGAVEVGDAA